MGVACCCGAPAIADDTDMPPLVSRRVAGSTDEGDTYKVVLTKDEGQKLGVNLDFLDGLTGRIDAILMGGLVEKWNSSCMAAARVNVGDHVVEVNGVRENAVGMQQQIMQGATLSLVLLRPFEFKVSVTKGASLGVELQKTPTSTSVMLLRVGNGTIRTWNKERPELAVRARDRLVEVNGVRPRAGAEALYDTIVRASSSQRLDLVFARLRRPPSEPEPGKKMDLAGGTPPSEQTDGWAPSPSAASKAAVSSSKDDDAEADAAAEGGEDNAVVDYEEDAAEQKKDTGAPAGSSTDGVVTTMQIQLPTGVKPGQVLQVQSPDGRMIQIATPEGAQPGQTIRFEVPAA